MDKQFLLKILDEVIELTRTVVDSIKDQPFSVTEKNQPTDIVTSNDIASQRMLIDGLGKILKGSGFFCEEENVRDEKCEYVWVIDPIDGTANYSRGIANCAVSVALLHNGTGVLGVVRSIFKDECYSAVRGVGAWRNREPINVSQRSFKEGLLCTAMSLYKKDIAKLCSDVIFDLYMECNDIRRFGSAAMELCYLASGECELYFEIRVFPWDYAAGLIILKEAGGIIKSLQNKDVDFTKPSVIIGANSEENYNKLAEIVNKHIQYIPYED